MEERLLICTGKMDIFFNTEMIKQGFTNSYTKFPHPKLKEFNTLAKEVRDNERGLYSPSTCSGDTNQPAKQNTNKPTVEPSNQPAKEIEIKPTEAPQFSPQESSVEAKVSEPKEVVEQPKPAQVQKTMEQPVREAESVQSVAPRLREPPVAYGVVKKSVNDICHSPGGRYYNQTKKFESYNTLEECITSGGRLPER